MWKRDPDDVPGNGLSRPVKVVPLLLFLDRGAACETFLYWYVQCLALGETSVFTGWAVGIDGMYKGGEGMRSRQMKSKPSAFGWPRFTSSKESANSTPSRSTRSILGLSQ